ncbi:MAG: hypothetical protein WBX17_11285 [Microbacterium sp.]
MTNLSCSGGLLSAINVSWTLPNGGLPRTSYRWTVSGGLNGSGTIANPNATNVQISGGLLGLGSGTFRLYAVGPANPPNPWLSAPVSASVSVLSIVGSSCSPN